MKKLVIVIFALSIAAPSWAETPPDPTDAQLDKLMNYCPENATDNTKVKNCIAVNHESRIDMLEGGGSQTFALPSECIVSGAIDQIYIENGFARSFNSDGSHNNLWQAVESSVAWYAGDSQGRNNLAIHVIAGFGNENSVSPKFATKEDAGICLFTLIELLDNRVNINEGGVQ